MSFIAAAVVGGAGLLGKVGMGIAQSAKAKKIDKNNPFVREGLNPLLTKNLAESELMARTGMPSEQYNNSLRGINRGTSTYLRAFGRSGRAGSLLSVIRAQNDAIGNLNAADAGMRLQNQQRVFQQRGIVAGEQARLFNVNQREPYMYNRRRAADARAASQANIGGAFSDLVSIGAMVANAGTGGQGSGFGTSSVPGGGSQFTPFMNSYGNSGNLLNFGR